MNAMMSRYRHLLSGLSWQVGLVIFRQATAILAMLVVVRVFDRTQYGNYQLVFAAIGFLGVSSLSGMKSVITQSVARGHDGTYRAATRMSFLGACIGSAFALFYAVYLGRGGNGEIALALALAALLFPFARGLLTWQAYLMAKQQFRRSALTQSLTALSTSVLLMLVVLVAPHTIVPACLVFLAVQAVQNVIMHRKSIKLVPPEAEPETAALSYGFKTSFYDLFNVAGNVADRFIIFAALSPEALAGYAVARRLPEMLKDNLQQIRNVLVPEMSKRKTLTRSLNRKLNMLVLGILVVLIAVALLIIPWLIPWLFTDIYADIVIYCQVLLISAGVGAYGTFKFGFIISRLDTRSVRGITIASNIVRVGSAALLIPFYGLAGAVASTLIYRLVMSLSVHYFISKIYLGEQEMTKGTS